MLEEKIKTHIEQLGYEKDALYEQICKLEKKLHLVLLDDDFEYKELIRQKMQAEEKYFQLWREIIRLQKILNGDPESIIYYY